jgi:uncharacterized protein YceH (UPF0502 family)
MPFRRVSSRPDDTLVVEIINLPAFDESRYRLECGDNDEEGEEEADDEEDDEKVNDEAAATDDNEAAATDDTVAEKKNRRSSTRTTHRRSVGNAKIKITEEATQN